MESKIELDLCPFCGNKEHNTIHVKEINGLSLYFARCWMCGARTNVFETREKAAEAWNRRVK